jgi:hypothetical protein
MQGDGRIQIVGLRINKGNNAADFSPLKPGNVGLLRLRLASAAAEPSGLPTRQLLQAVNSKDKGQYLIVERGIKEGNIRRAATRRWWEPACSQLPGFQSKCY